MSKLTRGYIIRSGEWMSKGNPNRNSITIQYKTQAQCNRMLKKIKYQSRWCTYSTGYPLRINFDTR